MAKLKEITLKMVIDNEGNVAKIAQVGDAMERAGQQARNMNREVRNTSNALGNQTKATNLAGQTALEFSRIASDSAYGIRGMANNIGQVATMMGELSKTAPKGISAMGRLKFMGQQLGAAIMGPMGIIIAIQGLLAWLTLWESSTNNQTEAQKELNEELDITATKAEKTSQHIETLIAAMGQTGVVSTQAKKDLAELIPNYEKLRETMSLDEVSSSYKDYLFFQEQALGADQALADNRAEIMVLEAKMLEARATGNTALGEDTAKKIEQLKEDRETLQDISDTFTAPYLKLKELFREEDSEKEKQLPFRDFMARKNLREFKRNAREIGKEVDYLTESFMKPDWVKIGQLWTTHLDGIGGILDGLTATMNNFAFENEKTARKIFAVQKAAAVAGITIDTYNAASKAYAQAITYSTPLGASLVAAGVVAQGLARVTAVLAQQFDGESKLTAATPTSSAAESLPPVTTTGFSNLSGGETPGSAVRVYVLEHDIRTTTDKVSKTKVRSRL